MNPVRQFRIRWMRWILVSLLFASSFAGSYALAQLPDAPPDAATPPTSDSATARVIDDRLPTQELTAKILYEFLLAEIAGQRGQTAIAADVYFDLA
jgi:hypothetical protein